jgi:hypothetical protein
MGPRGIHAATAASKARAAAMPNTTLRIKNLHPAAYDEDDMLLKCLRGKRN